MDSVLVFPDISYMRKAEGGSVSDDEVHRLMYVAVTRARKEVLLAKPMGRSLRDRLYYDW
jgi:superfamily I DNA/RNA helicase